MLRDHLKAAVAFSIPYDKDSFFRDRIVPIVTDRRLAAVVEDVDDDPTEPVAIPADGIVSQAEVAS